MKSVKILLAALVCLGLFGCVQNPEITYLNNEVKLNDLQSARAKFNFNLHNPNILPINGKIDYTFYVEEKEFLSGQSETIDAPANNDTTFALEQDIDFAKFFGSAAEMVNAILNGQKSIKVRVAGQYTTKVLGFWEYPIKIDQEVDVPLPEFKTEDVTKSVQDALKNIILDDLKKLF
ncbi:hypothetical protein RDn1_122 [Candidatus Termititenax dinenymphae]|uniref:Late embryogenesis abundant protein LEA-2 subgroup domain-containing protein n=1 Tax=Candidatus Termititenax dinenymphae TaxID=2218523 RepID=A0A388TJI7_9BACT|nr:hypothetical protein RDn1_122 [Candidatus Termititenax dinenymphae]